MRLTIVGGGISGLATAFYVKQQLPECQVSVLEREPHLGGTMRTEHVQGFAFEVGSNGFLSSKPDTLELVKAAGAEHLLLPSNDAARVRYVYTDALHRLPESPPAFLRTPLLSWKGKLRVLAEVLVPPRREEGEETLQSFGYRRVGREFTDVFLDAMSAGIYASKPSTLSVNAAFPAVVRLEREHGGLFRGMLAKRKRQTGPGGILMSFKTGVSTFVEHLAATPGLEIRTGANVTGVRQAGAGWRISLNGNAVDCDALVLATPAYAGAELLHGVDPDLALHLEQIEYSPVAVVGLGYEALEHPLDGFGLLTTTAAGQDILGVLWDSSIFPDRAPPGRKSVRVLIGGQRSPELALREEAELVEMAREGVRRTMGVRTTPAVTFVKRWPRGIPNYPLGHLQRVDTLFRRLRAYPGLFLNSNAYKGIGLNDCVANSRACAGQIAEHLKAL